MAVDPHLIPGFEIMGRLAAGGVAQVFRARRDRDGLVVALKVTSLADLDPEFHPVARFTLEGQLLERLNHPALPRIYGFGVTAESLAWMALELVSGRPLGELRNATAIELLPVFIQIAEALQTVAQEGIVHRDVAPDNILVEERGARLQARLIDFGAAKDLMAGDAGSLTRHGAFLGKLAYASPEQLVGLPKGETIDFRSDIYSLGMTMYELLAGHPPIELNGLTQIVDAHLKGSFPPLIVALERGGPALRLVTLVTRMTARRRDDRPASWEEVLAELWRSREEVNPLADALARKRSDAGLDPAPPRPAPAEPLPAERVLSREVLVGRLVFGIGLAAFVGSLAFAFWYVHAHRPTKVLEKAIEAPPERVADTPPKRGKPTLAPAPPPLAAVDSRKIAAHPTVGATPRPKPPATAHARPTAAPAVEARGAIDVALLPNGELEEALDEATGKSVVSRQRLPARLELPAGRYRLRLVSAAADCVKVVAVTVRPGRTISIKETCIEIK